MALPDHDAAFGRLAAARLRAASAGVRLDAHPDPETWAAYADGGLTADEVASLDAHLSICASCRQLMVAVAPDSTVAPPALGVAEAPAPARVLPFRPRVTWAWMSIAAGLLGAATLWSVLRLQQPEMASTMAERTVPAPAVPPAGATATPPAEAKAVPTAPSADAIRPADPARARPSAEAPDARLSGRPPETTAERDRAKTGFEKAASESDDRRDRQAFAEAGSKAAAQAPASAPKPEASAGGAATGSAVANAAPVTPAAPPAAAARAPATPGVHGPAVNTQQQNLQQLYAQQREEAQARAAQDAARAQVMEKERAAAPVEAPRPAPEAVGGLAEVVSTTAPSAARSGSRAQGVGAAKRDVSASRARPDLALADASAVIGFAEPGGRLRWRIAGGSRIESSSDGGATWTVRHPATPERLRAGAAPAIDAAWVVGERGLVLRFAVPGSWAAVTRPAPVTLVAVAASNADTARVTAEDGRVFETTDGGRSWHAVAEAPR